MPKHAQNPEIRLLDGRFYAADPQQQYRWMRANAPVYWDEPGQVWGITKHADIMEVSKSPGTFCNSQGMRPDSPPIPSMINMDDPQHRKRRALVSRGFTPRRVEDHRPRVRQVCADLVARAKAKGRFDFVREVAAPLPMTMIGDMLGVREEDHDRLLRWSDDMLLGTSLTASTEVMENAARAFGEYAEYNRQVVADRRAKPAQDDLMSILVHAQIDGERLDDEALLQESLLILIGGDETTRHVLSGGMYELLRHPEQYHFLAEHPQAIATAVEEMLRWVTPIQNMARTATRDVDLRGETIRAGDKLLLLYPSANRDEEVFRDAFTFDVRRDPNPHVAFGGYGAHFCLGASLARLELNMMFAEILRELPNLRLVANEPPPRRPSNFVVGIEHLHVELS